MTKPRKTAAVTLLFFSLFSFLSVQPATYAASEISINAETGAAVFLKTPDQAENQMLPVEAPQLPDAYHDFFMPSPLSPAEDETADEAQSEVSAHEQPRADETGSTNFDLALSNDTYSGTSVMWGFSRVNAEQAWSLSRGAGVAIAVIDTGLDMNHEDILGNVYSNLSELNGLPGVDDDGNGFVDDFRGWDFVNQDNNPTDDNGHGTHVSGIAAAVSDNGRGIAGVAPDAKIIPVKVLDASGSGTIDNVIKGIKYAADLGAKVINMSLGIAKRFLSNPLLQAFQDAVNYALGKGAVVITAAGNESVETSTTAPAGLNNTIAVGATDSRDRKAYFSNKSPDLAAPGVDIGSLYPGNRYAYMSGTSMASPFVAGATALLYSYYGATYAGWSGSQIYSDVYTRLTRSSTDLGKKGYDSSFGYGLLNAYAALTYTVSGAAATSQDSGVNGKPAVPGSGAGAAGISGLEGASRLSALVSRSLGNWYKIEALSHRKESGLRKSRTGKRSSRFSPSPAAGIL